MVSNDVTEQRQTTSRLLSSATYLIDYAIKLGPALEFTRPMWQS